MTINKVPLDQMSEEKNLNIKKKPLDLKTKQ